MASDLGLHCLPITLLRISRLKWVNCIMQIVVWKTNIPFRMLANLNINYGVARSLSSLNLDFVLPGTLNLINAFYGLRAITAL